MKKLILILCSAFLFQSVTAQDSTSRTSRKADSKKEKKQRTAAIQRQEEEGVLVYNKQTSFGLQLRTDGYGLFFELGRARTPRFTNLYLLELTEIKHRKEDKITNTNSAFNNTFFYGKVNNFYQFKLGFGQQYIFGQKGNKNGIAVMGIYQGGLSLGLLRPYYLDVNDNSERRAIRYNSKDSALFLNTTRIIGSSGLSKGWNELEVKPGLFAKAALRFDFGKYNEQVKAVQIGLGVEAYAQEIEIMVKSSGGQELVKPSRLFMQGHIAFIFGSRK